MQISAQAFISLLLSPHRSYVYLLHESESTKFWIFKKKSSKPLLAILIFPRQYVLQHRYYKIRQALHELNPSSFLVSIRIHLTRQSQEYNIFLPFPTRFVYLFHTTISQSKNHIASKPNLIMEFELLYWIFTRWRRKKVEDCIYELLRGFVVVVCSIYYPTDQ